MQAIAANGDQRAERAEHTERQPHAATSGRAVAEPLDYPLVVVEWHDAWFDLDLEVPEARRADYLVRTVGFLVGDGPRVVSLAQEILPEGDGFRAVTHIPVQIVDRMTPLAPSSELRPG